MSAHTRTKPTLTPPTSDEGNKPAGSPASELSDLEPEEDDIGDIDPDHYYEGGRIPVFKPVSSFWWNALFWISTCLFILICSDWSLHQLLTSGFCLRPWISFAASRRSSKRSTGTA